MHNEIQAYLDVRTANALDLTVEQVATVNRLECTHEHDIACTDAEAVRLTGSAAYLHADDRKFDVEIANGRLLVSWRENEWRYDGEVLADGTVKVR